MVTTIRIKVKGMFSEYIYTYWQHVDKDINGYILIVNDIKYYINEKTKSGMFIRDYKEFLINTEISFSCNAENKNVIFNNKFVEKIKNKYNIE